MKEGRGAWWPVVAWAALILVLTSVRVSSPSVGGLPLDKAAHVVVYAGLGVMLERARRSSGRHAAASGWLVFGAGASFAALDEIHQLWLSWRSPTPGDWVADLIGLAVGIGLYPLVLRSARRSSGDRGGEPGGG